MIFSAILLREKFVIRDTKVPDAQAITALSNRICLHLMDSTGHIIETFIIRSQAMHTCIRMAAKLVQTFRSTGPIMARELSFNFAEAWEDVIEDYDRRANEKIWVAIYNGGKRIYGSNEYHAFLDVIENCDARNTTGNYDSSLLLAEEVFANKGKQVAIDYEAHTGMVLDIKNNRGRCGLILRTPSRRTNFNYTVEEKKGAGFKVNAVHCLTIAAAFLEGFELAFFIGTVNEGLRLGTVQKYSKDDHNANAARKRMVRLANEIQNFETMFTVYYRPERPEFPEIVVEAEKHTRATPTQVH